MKTNYHTHTTRCQHAAGTDEAYVKAAVQAGFDVLGFADHAPWPFETGYVSGIRMTTDEWADYRDSVLSLRQRYQGVIDIRLGLESEYFPRYRDHLLRLREDGCEYLLLGQHFSDTEEFYPYVGYSCKADDEVKQYADSVAEALTTGLFAYVAHPDLYMKPRREFDRVSMEAADVICQAAREAKVPLEYNLLGLLNELEGNPRGYPSRDFWAYIRKWEPEVILGVDAHQPAHLTHQVLWDTGVKNVRDAGHRLIADWK